MIKVVHCDLKAANILFTKNGNVKLSTFGASLNMKAVVNFKQDVITASKANGIGHETGFRCCWDAKLEYIFHCLSDMVLIHLVAPEVISLNGASPA